MCCYIYQPTVKDLFLHASDFFLQGPDLQNILQQSYDYLTIMLKLRSTYDGRLIYQTSYGERNAFLRYDLLVKSRDHLRQCL